MVTARFMTGWPAATPAPGMLKTLSRARLTNPKWCHVATTLGYLPNSGQTAPTQKPPPATGTPLSMKSAITRNLKNVSKALATN